MTEHEKAPKGGCLATGLGLFGSMCAPLTLVSAVNVAFDLDLEIRVYGTNAQLPTDWMAVIALAVISAITIGIAALITSAKVKQKYQTYPWLKWATPLVIILGLTFGFYATYYTIEYAGPLHYATRSNDIETVKKELKKGVEDNDFRYSIDECIKLSHVDILKILLAHPNAQENIKDDFIYALEIGSMDVILTFIEAGVGSEGKYGDFLAHFLAVSELPKDEKEQVGLKLLETGASPEGVYTGGYMGIELTALEQAKKQGLTKLANTLELE